MDTILEENIVQTEVKSDFDLFLQGINKFYDNFHVREQDTASKIADFGTTELLYYPAETSTKSVVLFIPSLINKYHIFDLLPEHSLIKQLWTKHHVYTLNWQDPSEDEAEFGIGDYVARLQEILSFLTERHNGKVKLVGYCFGGTLAAVLNSFEPEKIAKTVLIAAPWDFSDSIIQQVVQKVPQQAVKAYLNCKTLIDKSEITQFFISLDLDKVYRKYVEYSTLEPGTLKHRLFTSLESWLHNTVNVTTKVTSELYYELAQQQLNIYEEWKVNGRLVSPAEINNPVLIVAPANDRLVSQYSAMSICEQLNQFEIFKVPTGHIGMMVSDKAKQSFWPKIKSWL